MRRGRQKDAPIERWRPVCGFFARLHLGIKSCCRRLSQQWAQMRVYLVSIQPMISLLTSNEANVEALYPLTGLMSLTTFNRLIYLRPSGLISDSSQLDLLFTLPMETPVLGIAATHREGAAEKSIVIFQPSLKAYNETASAFPVESYSDDDFMQRIPAMTDFAEDQVHLVTKTSTLMFAEESFDARQALEATAYIHLSDPDLPGPEYYLSDTMLAMARPTRPEPRKAWERAYELFRERRIDLCGLDLEPVKPDPAHLATNDG